ncbi:MAG: DUF2752 domain-containing protein [Verrucomicrobia bacterium]|nr:DUF2752 domain-containing protein [Verrucomicrobiota bacterium]
MPPPLPGRITARPARQAIRSLALLLGLMLIARVALDFQLPVPPCPLREMTGVPCPFCGGTRTFAALARLDFAAALRLNPLVCVAACVASVLWLLALLRTEKPLARLRSLPDRGAVWKWLLATALAANWLYLWFHLPR